MILENVCKSFGSVKAVNNVSLNAGKSEFIAVIGPSGCGKTTLLRMIAGFEKIDSGRIFLDDCVVSSPDVHVPAEKRGIGIVFQTYALWPHMSVADNVGYPLRVAGIRGEAYKAEVKRGLKSVGLDGFEDRRPAALSGGQRQRVALARCLVMKPSLVLLDEPLANLDVHLRASMMREFATFHQQTGATMIYITHDQSEAMTLADRVAVMEQGRLIQVEEPRKIYREPATTMVAGFIGEGSVLTGTVSRTNGQLCTVDMLGIRVKCRCRPDQGTGPVKVSLRPEDMIVSDGELDRIPARVTHMAYRGGSTALEVEPLSDPGSKLKLNLNDQASVDMGSVVHLSFADGWVIPEDNTLIA
jgi:iron(III) transport system ATP-binding protein